MSNNKSKPNRLQVVISLSFISLIMMGCDLIFDSGEPMELDRVYVGIFNTIDRFPATQGSTDAIWVTNDQYDEYMGLNPDYYLDWNGRSFSASYQNVYTAENGYVMTTTIEITGSVSSNYNKLETFTGNRKLVQYNPDSRSSDEVDQWITVKNVPLEKSADYLDGQINGDLRKYVVNAYWSHTIITSGKTQIAETSNLDLSGSNNELQVSFNKEY